MTGKGRLQRNATIIAYSSTDKTVERTSMGPHRQIGDEAAFALLLDRRWADAVAFAQRTYALFTPLY